MEEDRLLTFLVNIDKANSSYASFATNSISGSNTLETIHSEIAGGAALNAISAHKRVKLLIPNYPHAAHQLFLLHHNERDLAIQISFINHQTVQKVAKNGKDCQVTESQVDRRIAKMELSNCQLVAIKAVEDDAYEASFKVNGGMATSINNED